jgi:hypothetical protein
MSVEATRIMYIPSIRSHLLMIFGAGLMVPLIVAWFPAMLLLFLVWVSGSFSAAWHTALVLAGLTLLVGLVLASWFLYDQLKEIRWIDLEPPRKPTRLDFKKLRGTDSMAVTDLRSVHVKEVFKVGKSAGCTIRFTSSERQFSCPMSGTAPLGMSAAKLGEWFTERLGYAGVEVTDETVIERAYLPIDHWYTRYQVAAIWGVPIDEVDDLCVRLKVVNRRYIPRIGMMHGVNHPVQAFDPDDVYIVAPQVLAARHPAPPTGVADAG